MFSLMKASLASKIARHSWLRYQPNFRKGENGVWATSQDDLVEACNAAVASLKANGSTDGAAAVAEFAAKKHHSYETHGGGFIFY